MNRIRLVHWNAGEAKERAERLQALGYEVAAEVPSGPSFLRELRESPPQAVLIDLARLPSQGRDLAIAIRKQKAIRQLPLLFIGGKPDKVARVREVLPDAVYTDWEQVAQAIEQAIAHPPEAPVEPESLFAGYTGKPLVQKLGIRPDSVVATVGAPEDFLDTLGPLPPGVELREQAGDECDLIIWFTPSRTALQAGLEEMQAALGQGAIWIAWPKKASAMTSDLTQQIVRETGLAAGWVDYKICSIDKTWSGLLFTRRK